MQQQIRSCRTDREFIHMCHLIMLAFHFFSALWKRRTTVSNDCDPFHTKQATLWKLRKYYWGHRSLTHFAMRLFLICNTFCRISTSYILQVQLANARSRQIKYNICAPLCFQSMTYTVVTGICAHWYMWSLVYVATEICGPLVTEMCRCACSVVNKARSMTLSI